LTIDKSSIVDPVMPVRYSKAAHGHVEVGRVHDARALELDPHPVHTWPRKHDLELYAHPFLFRQPLRLPPGTVIRGVPPDTVIVLLAARLSDK